MSTVKRQIENKRPHKKERKFRRETDEGNAANWNTVDAVVIRDVIARATAAGGAIRFGYTIDGGAYALGIYGDGASPYTEYVRPSEDIERVLSELGAAFDGEEADEEPVTRTAGKKLPATAAGQPQNAK